MKAIELSGVVGGPDFNQVKLQRFLDDAVGEQIQVVIASRGGCPATGRLMAALLRARSDLSIVIKFAGSAAVAPALASSRREILAGGSFFLHRNWQCAVGTCEDLERTIRHQRELDLHAAKIYAEASGQTVEFILELMSGSTVLDANQALQLGFVHSILDAPGGVLMPGEVWHRTATSVVRTTLHASRDRNSVTAGVRREAIDQAVQLADYPPEPEPPGGDTLEPELPRADKLDSWVKLDQRETEQLIHLERRLHRFAHGLSPDPRIPQDIAPLNPTWICECGAVNYHPPGLDGRLATICNTCLEKETKQ